MYEEMKITTPSGGCDCLKKQQSKTCKDTYNKIDLGCFGLNHFAVENYFSELVHDWEKEAARHNLGITELENIHYETEMDENNNELLTYIVFLYRRGYELVTRKFRVAPEGPKGNDGKDGSSAYLIATTHGFNGTVEQWLASLKAEPAQITKATVSYCGKDCDCCPLAEIKEIENKPGEYELILKLHMPELTSTDITNIIEIVRSAMLSTFYTKIEINEIVSRLEHKINALETIINNLGISYDSDNSTQSITISSLFNKITSLEEAIRDLQNNNGNSGTE